MKACSVRGCLTRENGKTNFFFFPRRSREYVFQQWVEFCQDETLKELKGRLKRWVCDRHFKPQDYAYPNRIRLGAIPSLCGPPPKLRKIPEPPATEQDQLTTGITEAVEAVACIPSKPTHNSTISSIPVTVCRSLVPSTPEFPVTSTTTPKRPPYSIPSTDETLWIPFEHSYANQGRSDERISESVDAPDLSDQSHSLVIKENCTPYVFQLRKRQLYRSAKKKENELRKLSRKYRKIRLQIHELCDSKNSITTAFESLTKRMSAVSVIFLSSHLKASSKKTKGKKWTSEEKTVALSFYKRNPKAYTLMSNFFALPNKKTLERLVKTFPSSFGTDAQTCTTLSQQVEQMNMRKEMGNVNIEETNVCSDLSIETYSVSESTELKRIPLTSNTSVLIMTSDDNNLSLDSMCGKVDATGGVVQLYCRICGAKSELTKLISIFDESGAQLDLLNKISRHLQIYIDKDDTLPQQVCTNCVRKLNVFEELWQKCQKSDAKLRRMFEKNVSKRKSFPEEPPPVVSSLPSNNEQVEFSDSGNHEQSKRFSVTCNEQENSKEVKNQEEKNPVLCDNCGKWFKNIATLRCHKRTHLDDSLKKKHGCTLCTKTFASKFRLSEHMNIHKGVRPYSCSECGKKFYKRQHVCQHRQIHRPDNQKVICEICEKKFCRRSNLLKHFRRHFQDRKYKCHVCGDEFALRTLMLSHRKMHTQQDVKQKFEEGSSIEENICTCELCGKIFMKKSSLLLHLRTHKEEADCSRENAVKWSCSECGKELSTRASLQYHVKSQHSSERPWCCQYCAEGFMSRDSLLAHERIHTGEIPFKCNICDKGFRTAGKLTQHMLHHSEKRNFQCPYCEKCFRRKGTLIVHTRIHTGERPFVCDLCGRPFIRKNDMLKHQHTHIYTQVSMPQFSCDICGLLFDLQKDLVDHKEMSHSSDVDTDILRTVLSNEIFSNVTHISTEDGRKILLSNTETVESDVVTV